MAFVGTLAAMSGTSCAANANPSSQTPSPSGSGCSVASIMLPRSAVSGFSNNVENPIPRPPFKGNRTFAGFVDGFERGFLSDVALSSPYWQQEDARARALGYTVGQWPLVPLEGRVVSDHPGQLLELYEIALVWNEDANAAAWVQALQPSTNPVKDERVTNLAWLPSTFSSAMGTFGGDTDAAHESYVRTVGRVGRVTLQLEAQGGDGLAASSFQQFFEEAVRDAANGCAG